MAHVAHEDARARHQDAEGQVELPGRLGQRGQREAQAHEDEARREHHARPEPVHEHPHERREGVRCQEPGRERRRGSARDQPNSSRIEGKKSENAVRALTTIPIVTNAVPTRTQP